MHPNQISQWKDRLLASAASAFAADTHPVEPPIDIKALHAEIGELTLENDFFRRRAQPCGTAERKAMINRSHDLPSGRSNRD